MRKILLSLVLAITFCAMASCTTNAGRILYNDRIVAVLRLPFNYDDRFIDAGVESNAFRVPEYSTLHDVSIDVDTLRLSRAPEVFISLYTSAGFRAASPQRILSARVGRGGAFVDTAIVLMKNSWVWARCDSVKGNANVIFLHLGIDIPRETEF